MKHLTVQISAPKNKNPYRDIENDMQRLERVMQEAPNKTELDSAESIADSFKGRKKF